MTKRPTAGSKITVNPIVRNTNVAALVLDAAEDFKSRQRGNAEPSRPLKIHDSRIKIQNFSGGLRSRGEIVQIGTYLLSEKQRLKPFFQGNAVTAAGCFAVLLDPVSAGDFCAAQVDDKCPAIVNVLDVTHTGAKPVFGSHVLVSTDEKYPPVQLLDSTSTTGEQGMWVLLRDVCHVMDEACPDGTGPDGSKNSLCIKLGDRTIKADVKNGELCVREVEPGSGTGSSDDECDENSLVIDVCEECAGTGTGSGTGTGINQEDCPCVETIDAASYAGNPFAWSNAADLPVYPENNPSLITTDGRVGYRVDSGSLHRWIWTQLHGSEYKIHAVYWDEITNPIIRIINCNDDTVEEVQVGQVIDGGEPE